MYALTGRRPVTSLGLRWVLITELYLSLSGHLNGGQSPAILFTTNRQPIIVSSCLSHPHWASVWLAVNVCICMQNLDKSRSIQECSASVVVTRRKVFFWIWMVCLIWQNGVRIIYVNEIIADYLAFRLYVYIFTEIKSALIVFFFFMRLNFETSLRISKG